MPHKKSGANIQDQKAIADLHKAGHNPDYISNVTNIEVEVVQRFIGKSKAKAADSKKTDDKAGGL